jgi:hypothetical protein
MLEGGTVAEMTTFEWDRQAHPELPTWMHERNREGWFVSGMPMPTERGTLQFSFVKEDVSMLRPPSG